jgi:hypothetical protein
LIGHPAIGKRLSMTRLFINRAERDACLARALSSAGPIIITGERGMGRTTILGRALEQLAAGNDQVLRLSPSGEHRFAALRASFPHRLPPPTALLDAVRAIAGYAGDRRLVVAVDDAHLVDHASLLALCELSRAGKAVLLVTRPLIAEPPGRPDPSECLSYERGVRILILKPLSVSEVAEALAEIAGGPVSEATAEAVHAATGGNPQLMYTLADQARLAERLTRHGQRWRVAFAPRGAGEELAEDHATYPGAARLVEAAWSAWEGLAIEHAQQLCQLALCCGLTKEIAPIWAALLLFQGGAPAASGFLGSLPEETVTTTPRLALVMALTLALGLGRADDASRFLSAAAERGQSPELMWASRAWLLAMTGQADAAFNALGSVSRVDQGTAVFVHATRAALTRLWDRHAETVFHLRRALAFAESGSSGFPWLRPYLKASLIDAMMLSGRVTEAVSLARRFHAREPGSGWDLSVALNALIANQATSRAVPFRRDQNTVPCPTENTADIQQSAGQAASVFVRQARREVTL